MSVLQVHDLTVDFAQRRGPKFRAVDHVSFELVAGETLALVGESGSGKSTIARALARLLRPTGGEVLLHGRPVGHGGRKLRDYRREVQMVFQDPFASLNPAFTVGHHLRRPLRIYGHPRSGLEKEVEALLTSVNMVPAPSFVPKYPHELSGGQRQRVAIARALATQPGVILADEPVSMLDVSIRLEILNLLDGLKRDRDLALLYITHDLATARYFSTQIMVMYRGEIVERGQADDVILRPAHPYTQLLEASVPGPRTSHRLDDFAPAQGAKGANVVLAGERAEASAVTGCRFRGRCPQAMEVCATHPTEQDLGDG
ncbi:MAG: oligopeptide/dipeptide ABC transporter ATP-binding protein, partial [Acidimicrobiales bacterium]